MSVIAANTGILKQSDFPVFLDSGLRGNDKIFAQIKLKYALIGNLI